jgi:predicted NAD/FAD-binding protein
MVANRRNYPTLYRLLGELDGIETADCEMSFAYAAPAERAGFVVNRGARVGPEKHYPEPQDTSAFRNLLPALLPEILRFCRQGCRDLEAGTVGELTLGEYLALHRISSACIRRYVVALGTAIWSTPPGAMLSFPAESFLGFFNNHGLLATDPPQWQYIKGGSQRYIQALARCLRGPVFVGADVQAVARGPSIVRVQVRDHPPQVFDFVVLAVHADQALGLLAAPTEDERRALGAWQYQPNDGVLHTDESVLPPDRRLWASWNCREDPGSWREELLQVTYHLNRLQGHGGTRHQYFVTLNPTAPVADERVVCPLRFTHPIISGAAFRSRAAFVSLNGANRTYYCGSYFGYGFHEDAVKSGLAVAEAFGVTL